MSRYEGSPAVIIERRKGTPDSPFSNMNESLVVAQDGKVLLSEIPNELNKVIVTSAPAKTWYEIKDGELTENAFKVDYINKLVTFNIANVGKQLNFRYTGEGNHYYSPHSIYTKLEDGNVAETLGDLVDGGREAMEALSTLNDKLDEINTVRDNAISATNDTRNVITEGNQVIVNANNRIGVVNGKITEATTKIGELDGKLTQATSTIESVNQQSAIVTNITNSGQAVIDNAQSLINNVKSVGEFNLSIQYKKNNIVSINGSSYIALQDTRNNPLPVLPIKENANWRLLVLKGDKGDKGDTGAALSIQGKLTNISQLPANGSAGQAYTVNGELYVWSVNTNMWENVGNIKGEKGDNGDTGEDGDSAYQIAVTNGFVGTEVEWIASLKGAKGDKGEDAHFDINDVPSASLTARGLMTQTQVSKLNGISSGANYVEVLDELTSTSTTSAVSANKAKVLSDKIDILTGDVSDHELRLEAIENGAVTTKADVTGLNREVAYLKLKQDADYRIEGGTVFADDMNGTRFGFELKTAKTITTTSLAIGETILSDKISAVENGEFEVGSKVTVMDAVNSEKVTITRSETVETFENFTATNKTVINNAYSTAGNGGRKIVRLSNGTLVAIARDGSNFRMYASLDKGSTWVAKLASNMYGLNDFAICAYGEGLALIYKYSNEGLRFIGFNENAEISINEKIVDSSQTAIGNVSIAYDKATNTLHAAWASKNATYPNSFNIRYSKSTDGGAVWSTVEQIVTLNTSGSNADQPTVTVKSDGNPILIFKSGSSSATYVKCFALNSGSWSNFNVYNNGSYAQNNFSAITDKNGHIHVAWHGYDATHTTTNYIRYSKSTDGGTTWSAMQKLVAGSNASITTDKNGNIFITYENASSTYYIKSTDNGSNWSSPTLIGTGTNPSSLVDNSLVYTVPPTIQMTNSNVVFNGNWTVPKEEYHLECSPLTKAYTANAIIAESTMNADGTFMNALGVKNNNVMNSIVIADTYSTAGNGGRKIVRLDNGNLILTMHKSNSMNISISHDNGNTWTSSFTNNTYTSLVDVAICSLGSYAIFATLNSGSVVCGKLNQNGQYINDTGKVVDNVQTALGNISLAYDKATNTLHAAWSSKNTTYPNSFNIRYSKSTDGGATWSTVEQIVTLNTSGSNADQPTVTVKSDGNPILIFKSGSSSATYVKCFALNSGSWSNFNVYNNGSYAQNNFSAITDKNGHIHVAWHGYDATHTTTNYIRYSKSTDGGATWSTIQKLVAGSNASISVNAEGKLFISYESGSNLKTHVSNDGGTTWVDSGVTATGTSPSALDDTSLNFTTPLTVAMGTSSVVFNGAWSAIEEVQKLTASATYKIPSTDYVGAFVQKSGNVTITAYLNDNLMDLELYGNEYQFEGSLASESPVTLRLELSRSSTANGENDKITRVLGGRS